MIFVVEYALYHQMNFLCEMCLEEAFVGDMRKNDRGNYSGASLNVCRSVKDIIGHHNNLLV